MNKIQLIGYLGQDPELRTTQSGISVCNFTLATSDKNKDGAETTTWHRVVLWKYSAERASQNLKKGDKCFVEGKLQKREYDDKQGNKKQSVEVIAFRFEKCEKFSFSEKKDTAVDLNQAPQFEEDDIPF